MKTVPASVLRFSVGIALMSQISIARSEVILRNRFLPARGFWPPSCDEDS